MPRTAIPVTEVPFQGSLNNPTFTAADATNDMDFINDGRTDLVVKNGGAGAVVATIKAVSDEAGRSVDESVTIAAGNDAYLGPFRPRWWNQLADGKIQVDFDVDTSVTVAAFRRRG